MVGPFNPGPHEGQYRSCLPKQSPGGCGPPVVNKTQIHQRESHRVRGRPSRSTPCEREGRCTRSWLGELPLITRRGPDPPHHKSLSKQGEQPSHCTSSRCLSFVLTGRVTKGRRNWSRVPWWCSVVLFRDVAEDESGKVCGSQVFQTWPA